MSKKHLTNKQANVLGYLKHFREVHGYMPTYREIADGLGYKSSNGAYEHCLLIERKGYIKMLNKKARAIVLI